MIINFDKFNRAERQVLTLANPNGLELGQLGAYMKLNGVFNFNAISIITFQYPYSDEPNDIYHEIQTRRHIYTESLGRYVITSINKTNNGIREVVEVIASSLEIELNSKKINIFKGTYKFWDDLNPNETLLGTILNRTNWKVKYVTEDLKLKYRNFDTPNSSKYGFLMNDIENAYECIFDFDTYNKTISAYTPRDVVTKTDLFIGYNNLIKEQNIVENSDSLFTSMNCYGGGDLSISLVNPLGGTAIYNFDYFKPWMTDSLRTAILNWENLIETNQSAYSDLLTRYKNENGDVLTLQSELTELEIQLKAKKVSQAEAIQSGNTNTSYYRQLFADISALDNSVSSKKNELSNAKNLIEPITSGITAINKLLSFDNNNIFSNLDRKELQDYIFEKTYQDNAFIKTSTMSPVAIQDMAQELYNQGISLLNKIAKPTFEVTINSSNFILYPSFAKILNTLDNNEKEKMKQILGASVNLEVGEDNFVDAIILQINLDFDDPTNFSIVLSSKYRSSSAEWAFGDLYGEGSKISDNITFDYSGLKDAESYSNDLVDFMNGVLDATKNEIVNNSKNIEVQIDETGIICKRLNDDKSGYLGEQVWLTSNVLAFSKNKFETVDVALGRLVLPDGTYSYGLNAGVLMGKQIFSSAHTISNENNTIVMDSNGFVMTTNDGSGRIVLSPDDGIKIQGNKGSGFEDKFYVDKYGNVTMEGKVIASEGEIAGWIITSDSLTSPYGDYLRSNGTGKLGLLTWNLNSATFDGNIYAKNLKDKVQNNNIAERAISPDKLDRVYATRGEFQELYSEFAQFEYAIIRELDAVEIRTERLIANKISVVNADISNLAVKIARIDRLYVTSAEVNSLVTNKLYAINADIDNLSSTVATIDNAYISRFQANVSFAGALNCISMGCDRNMNVGGILAVGKEIRTSSLSIYNTRLMKQKVSIPIMGGGAIHLNYWGY